MQLNFPSFETLTPKQQELVNKNLTSSNPYLLVKWYGWSWKTVVAYHRALKIQQNNKKVLFLCYGKALKKILGIYSEDSSTSDKFIFNIDSFYGKIHSKLITEIRDTNRFLLCQKEDLIWDQMTFVEKADIENEAESIPMDFDGWYFEIYDRNKDRPYLCYTKNNQKIYETKWFGNTQKSDFLHILFSRYKENVWWYDEIIIDEAQDLSPDWLESLKLLTKTMSIFFDENQIIFSWEGTGINSMESIFWTTTEELKEIKRCSKEICEFAAKYFLPPEETSKLLKQNENNISYPGSYPEILEFNQDEEWKNAIYDRMLGGSLILLSSIEEVDKIYTFLQRKGVNHLWKYHNKENSSDFRQEHMITTYESAKWLEADSVFVVITKQDYENRRNAPEWSKEKNKFYVLSSRAKKHLYIIFTYKDE